MVSVSYNLSNQSDSLQSVDLRGKGYLYRVERVDNGAGRGRGHAQGLVFLQAVREQAVDGAVVIVRISMQRLERTGERGVKQENR